VGLYIYKFLNFSKTVTNALGYTDEQVYSVRYVAVHHTIAAILTALGCILLE